MPEVIFLKKENREQTPVRLTLYLKMGLIEDLMDFARIQGINAESPERVIEIILRSVVENVKTKG